MIRARPWSGAVMVAVLCLSIAAIAQSPAEQATAMEEATVPDFPPEPGMITLPTGDNAAETVFMRFINSRTGLGVAPKTITVDGQPVRFEVARKSLVGLPVPAGRHTIEVTAEGFEPMRVDVTTGNGPTPVMEVELDPSDPLSETEVPADRALLLGTVSDADTAEPLSGAKIEILGSELSETTTASGEFRFEIKIGEAAAQSRPAVAIEVHADGYTPLRLKDLPLDAGGRARVPVKLSRETSGTAELIEINAGRPPGGQYAIDWTFDVTLR